MSSYNVQVHNKGSSVPSNYSYSTAGTYSGSSATSSTPRSVADGAYRDMGCRTSLQTKTPQEPPLTRCDAGDNATYAYSSGKNVIVDYGRTDNSRKGDPTPSYSGAYTR